MAEKKPYTVRLGHVGRSWIDTIATETGANLTVITKACFAIARRHETELRALIREMTT